MAVAAGPNFGGPLAAEWWALFPDRGGVARPDGPGGGRGEGRHGAGVWQGRRPTTGLQLASLLYLLLRGVWLQGRQRMDSRVPSVPSEGH